ncbi:APC family permease [Advenella mimigardefordensis]|uniref:Amino acid permease domain-containing protein n=1 Tax=Advenella mimigardefordensis (strain DSM 17166 / LMG 22922 / DPN7) TaxID=1247726 RepID=W0PCU4_ADVMD|nr:amino acid permease [Advenella mimigardefordensis]AHG63220.1 amino acid permease domain-containing protein [Advenella mimigardefordensis DPN7]
MTDQSQSKARPQPQLSVFDAVTIVVGLVVGIGIFRTPSIVAANVAYEWLFILVWIVGGLITLVGALCYAELSAAHPHAGGEYHFLSRAYGRSVAMMFGWARCTVIQTGAIAAVAFMLGDYVAQIVPLGPYGPAIYAAISVIVLTTVNFIGTAEGKNLQIIVTFIEIAAVIAIILFGLTGSADVPANTEVSADPQTAALGMAMIFVLLTYGGWNEAAYLTGELKDAPRNIAKVLMLGTLILVTLYVLTNLALVSILGLDGLRASNAVAADMMHVVAGEPGRIVVTLAIIVAAISTLNATIFTGARVFYVMARDMTILQWVAVWDRRGKTPANGQIMQGMIALALIAMGAITRDGFKAMVDYTAPVFWAFMLLVGLSLFILRRRHPDRILPYKVPLYPITPIVFCLTCLYMFYASVVYTGVAALIGLAVLAAGAPILLFRIRDDQESDGPQTQAEVTALK